MVKNAQKTLEVFQGERNRSREELFAAMFSENPDATLAFINNDQAYTNGTDIVVDPAKKDIYCNVEVLRKSAELLHWPKDMIKAVATNPWLALKLITRAQLLHECLHILYTAFPSIAANSSCCKTEKQKDIICFIENIIEDAYIENVGCSEYDNLALYLNFGRVAEGIAGEALAKKQPKPSIPQEDQPLYEYLSYIVGRVLYSFMPRRTYSSTVKPFVEATEALFLEGSLAPTPKERSDYAVRIFKLILPLIKEPREKADSGLGDALAKLVDDKETHNNSMQKVAKRSGQEQTTSLRNLAKTGTTNENNAEKNHFKAKNDQAGQIDDTGKSGDAKKEKSKQGLAAKLQKQLAELMVVSQKEFANDLENYSDEGELQVLKGEDLGGEVNHKDIKVKVLRPKVDLSQKSAYNAIQNVYKLSINKYNRHFRRLLQGYVPMQEEKRLFGSEINARRLGDIKKRYWQRTMPDIDVPDLAVLLLVDGSGSMYGRRSTAAKHSAIILQEVLDKQGIPLAVVEHRGSSESYSIDINILKDFNSKQDEKYNLMKIHASNDNRDGLALYWVGKYIQKSVSNENKLVIVLSDGVPAHDGYYGQPAVQDTAEAVKSLTRGGVDVIGIALDEGVLGSTYEDLKPIYPNLILCNDLNLLTGQILEVVTRLLEKRDL